MLPFTGCTSTSTCRSTAVRYARAVPCISVRHAAQCKLRQQRLRLCATNGTETESPAEASADADSNLDEIRRLQALRREQKAPAPESSNIIQGAIEEAQLITWPKPQKAFFDTFLVLGIVLGSGFLLFSVNVLLAEFSDFWYHRG